ncbi:MAG TPA: hypothetical protein VI854_04575, partial [Acidimicrobiia bacterium]|nr:hypothetical protein [Acidimicrobiia bacterium]
MGDRARLFQHAPGRADVLSPAGDPGAGGLGDAYVRLAGLHLEVDGLLVHGTGADGDQVAAGEQLVLGHAAVDHLTVEPGADLEGPGPVLGHEGRLERGEVGVAHVDEAALRHPGAPTARVAETEPAGEHSSAQVELL